MYKEYTPTKFKNELKKIISFKLQEKFGNFIPSTILKKLIVKDYKYLNFANRSNVDFQELLNLAYQKELRDMSKTSFTKEESDLLKRYLENNSNLFNTFNIKILNKSIIKIISEDNLELIVRYPGLQNLLINLSNHKEILNVFNFAFNHLKEHYKFQIPLIENLFTNLNCHLKTYDKNLEQEADNFLKVVNEKIEDSNYEFSEDEKNIISYLALSPSWLIKEETFDYSYIKNYMEIYRREKDFKFYKDPSYYNFIDRFICPSLRFFSREFYDLEELKKEYKDIDETFDKKLYLEKKSIEIIDTIKKIEYKGTEEKTGYYENLYKEAKINGLEIRSEDLLSDIILGKYIKNVYAKKLIEKINFDKKEAKEYKTSNGKSYYIKELDEEFGRVITVLDAYNKGSNEKNFYNKWNTSKLSDNHALCYSYINESNPGVVDDTNKIMVSIKDFDSESLIDMSNQDMKSISSIPSLMTYDSKLFLPDSLANNTRKSYSELVIELQDITKDKYQKIQPSSIVCFEKITDASIRASIELSENLGKVIPIELIDRRKLAVKQMQKIKEDYEKFITLDKKDLTLVQDIITRFHNVRNAHQNSSLKEYILGENSDGKLIDENALFSKDKMNLILENIYDFIKKENIEETEIKKINSTIKKERDYSTSAIAEDIYYKFKELETIKKDEIKYKK